MLRTIIERTSAFLVAISWRKALAGAIVLCTFAGAAQAADGTNNEYIIGSGDSLQIFVWHNPELTASVPVRPDGKVSIPLVEDIPCAGRTPTQLAREIEVRLKKFIQDPTVTVIINSFVGLPSQQIRIVGAATQPKALPFRENMTVLDAMIAVGGLSDFAAGDRSKLIRTQNGQQTTLNLRLQSLLQDGDISVNQMLQPGDIIIIPQSYF